MACQSSWAFSPCDNTAGDKGTGHRISIMIIAYMCYHQPGPLFRNVDLAGYFYNILLSCYGNSTAHCNSGKIQI